MPKMLYHPMKGPDTKRLIETKLGKFTKLFSKPCLPTSSLARFNTSDPNLNLEGSLIPSRINSEFKAWTFLRKTPFSGVADWDSFHGGNERKRGPWKGAKQGSRCERGVYKGGFKKRVVVVVTKGRVLEFLVIRVLRDLKIAIDQISKSASDFTTSFWRGLGNTWMNCIRVSVKGLHVGNSQDLFKKWENKKKMLSYIVFVYACACSTFL